MVKCLFSFLCIFLILSRFSFADQEEAKLRGEYGPELRNVPYFLQFSFYKRTGKDWDDSFYYDRRMFLTKYESDLFIEQKKARVEARIAAAEARKEYYEKKAQARKIRDELKIAEEKARVEALAVRARQKAMDDAVRQQRKELEQMEKLATQGN